MEAQSEMARLRLQIMGQVYLLFDPWGLKTLLIAASQTKKASQKTFLLLFSSPKKLPSPSADPKQLQGFAELQDRNCRCAWDCWVKRPASLLWTFGWSA